MKEYKGAILIACGGVEPTFHLIGLIDMEVAAVQNWFEEIGGRSSDPCGDSPKIPGLPSPSGGEDELKKQFN